MSPLARTTLAARCVVLSLLAASCFIAKSAAAKTAPRDPEVARLLVQADTLWAKARWAAFDSVSAVAVSRAEAAKPADSTAIAHLLLRRGDSRFARAMYADTTAVWDLDRAIGIHERRGHPDSLEWAASLDYRSRFMMENGRADTALSVLVRARLLVPPGDVDRDSLRAILWISSGRAERYHSQPYRAVAAFDSAQAIRERIYGPDHLWVAETLSESGTVYARLNRPELSMPRLERSIAIIEHADGPDTRVLVSPLSGLATAQFFNGQIASSIETLERMLAIHSRVYGPNSPRLIPGLYNIANRLGEFGDWEGARAIYARLVPRAEAAFGAGSARAESVRRMAGHSAWQVGDTAAAAVDITRARAELQARPLDENHLANMIDAEYSTLLLARGDREGALRVARAGLTREIATEHPQKDALFALYETQASAQIALGDAAGLDSTRAQVLARFGAAPSSMDSHYREALRLATHIEMHLGRPDAWTMALTSEEADREDVLRNVRALPDTRALQMEGRFGEALDRVVALSARGGPEAVATAWDRVVRWRGLASAELARRRAPLAARSDTALATAHANWVRAMRRAAQLEVAGEDPAAGGPLDESRREAERAELAYGFLATSRGIARDSSAVGFPRIRAALRPDEALVSFVTLDAHSDTARTVAFITVGPRGALVRKELGRSAALAARVDAWRRAIGRPPARGQERAEELKCRRLGADVRTATWDRIAQVVGGARRVTLVTDGALSELPWHALPARGATRYLADAALEIHTPGSEREIVAPARVPGRGLLAIGGPDFGAPVEEASRPAPAPDTTLVAALEPVRGQSGNCTDTRAMNLAQLPGARAEAEDIAGLWNAGHASDPALLRVGGSGSEGAFKAEAPGREVLHLATHGIVWGEGCSPLYAQTRGVGGISPVASNSKPSAGPKPSAASAAVKLSRSPWGGRRVWLALAGANRARVAGSNENEGLLTADEVVTLDLSSVDWVVLSACQSGVGRQWPLEGSIGMQRAFRLAGARAAITSQWPISDDATRAWMHALYAARGEGRTSAGEAIGSANRAVLGARRAKGLSTHPFYWAAFTGTGW